MPRLIDDIAEPIELEWTKDAEGVYHHDHFRIVPSGGKFALEVVEGKGKKAKTTQACKGPLKVCKGFALDISEGRLVKLGSGNWGAPPPVEHLHPIEGEPVLGPAKVKTPVEQAISDAVDVGVAIGKEIAIEEAKTQVWSLPAIVQAITTLSREYPICALPPGSHFSQGGRFGTFIEMIGQDAKVEWEGKTTQWSGASPVKWAAERPIKAETKAPKQASAAPVEGQEAPTLSPSTPAKTPSVSKPPQSKEGKGIFGFAIWRVVTTLAVKGFTEDEIHSILKAHHSEKSSTGSWIKQAKRRADEGAALTPDQLKQLKTLVNKK